MMESETPKDILAGRHILLAEDDALVSLDIMGMLGDHGSVVVGPAWSVDYALDLAQNAQIDAAVVDINLRGGRAYAILEELLRRSIPFVLITTDPSVQLPRPYDRSPILAKPVLPAVLTSALSRLLSSTVAR